MSLTPLFAPKKRSLTRSGRPLHSAIALLSFACLSAAPAANAQVKLDFENLSNPANPGFTSQGSSVTQNGFTVTDTSNIGGLASVTQNPQGLNYTGSIALFNGAQGNSITTLTQNNGNPFTLNSIDIANLFAAPTTGSGVVFTGNIQGGGTVTQSFSHGPTNSLDTVTFGAGFTNLTSVIFSPTTARFQFDNVVLNGRPVTPATPEPGSIALFTGFAVSGGVFLKRRKK